MGEWLEWGPYKVRARTRLGRIFKMLHFIWRIKVWFRLFGLPSNTGVRRR